MSKLRRVEEWRVRGAWMERGGWWDHPKDTKTFWIQKIRKPSTSKRYKNLLDPRSRSEKLLDPKDTKTFLDPKDLAGKGY